MTYCIVERFHQCEIIHTNITKNFISRMLDRTPPARRPPSVNRKTTIVFIERKVVAIIARWAAGAPGYRVLLFQFDVRDHAYIRTPARHNRKINKVPRSFVRIPGHGQPRKRATNHRRYRTQFLACILQTAQFRTRHTHVLINTSVHVRFLPAGGYA